MDYITNLYRSKAEQLQEQVNFLEAQLQQLVENSPPASTFSGSGQGQQAFSDSQLEDQIKRNRRTGFFNSEIADDKQNQEYKDATAELARRRAPKPDTQSQIVIDTRAKAPVAPAPAKKAAPAPAKKAAPAPVPVQDEPIAPPANASPRVQATDAAGNPSNTPEARGQLQKDAMNPSGAHTPTPKTNERRNREEAERKDFWNDGADHGSARPPEPTAPQREFERSTQQPTTGVGPDGETLPQAEKRVRDNAQKENNWKAGQFVNNLLYNRRFKGEQDARTPAQDPDMATGSYSKKPAWAAQDPDMETGSYSKKPAWAQAKERAIDSWGQGSLPNNSGGMKNSNQNYGKGQDSDVQRGQFNISDPASPQQMSTQDNRPTSGRKPNYPSSTNDLLRLYGLK